MKAKSTKAWACSNCGRVYRHDESGKIDANTCCTCPGCEGLSSYFAARVLCHNCAKKENLKRAEEDVENAKKRLRELKRV